MNVRVVDQGPPDTAALAVVGAVVLKAMTRIESRDKDATQMDGPQAA